MLGPFFPFVLIKPFLGGTGSGYLHRGNLRSSTGHPSFYRRKQQPSNAKELTPAHTATRGPLWVWNLRFLPLNPVLFRQHLTQLTVWSAGRKDTSTAITELAEGSTVPLAGDFPPTVGLLPVSLCYLLILACLEVVIFF